MKRWIVRQLGLVALVCFAALPASSIDLLGTKRATFEWAPSPSEVAAYAVYVERNGGPRLSVELVQGTRATVEAEYGDSILVSVRAVAFLGETTVYSDYSVRSEVVHFVEPPKFGGDGILAVHCVECSSVEFRSIAAGDVLGEMAVPAGSWRIVAAADADGDGERDLLWRDENTGALLALLVNNFTLAGGASSYAPNLMDREAVGAADFDGDGAAAFVLHDLVGGDVEFMVVSGAQLTQAASLPADPANAIVAVADFTGDQHPDLLWSTAGGGLEIWSMQGFDVMDASAIGATAPADWDLVGNGDYNGDGNLDVLWRDSVDGSLYIWYLDAGNFVRQADLPWVSGDADLEVAGSANFTGVFGEEIVLQHRDSGAITVLFPFSELIASRLDIAMPGSRWSVVDVAN